MIKFQLMYFWKPHSCYQEKYDQTTKLVHVAVDSLICKSNVLLYYIYGTFLFFRNSMHFIIITMDRFPYTDIFGRTRILICC